MLQLRRCIAGMQTNTIRNYSIADFITTLNIFNWKNLERNEIVLVREKLSTIDQIKKDRQKKVDRNLGIPESALQGYKTLEEMFRSFFAKLNKKQS